jgi:hypothetical protein
MSPSNCHYNKSGRPGHAAQANCKQNHVSNWNRGRTNGGGGGSRSRVPPSPITQRFHRFTRADEESHRAPNTGRECEVALSLALRLTPAAFAHVWVSSRCTCSSTPPGSRRAPSQATACAAAHPSPSPPPCPSSEAPCALCHRNAESPQRWPVLWAPIRFRRFPWRPKAHSGPGAR